MLQDSAVPPTRFVHPGQLAASREPASFITILGSCVAVCLWDRDSKTGGLAHVILPAGPACELRFATSAVPALIEEVVALGGKRETIVAKLFGGASINAAFRERGNRLGDKNAEKAFELLEASGLPVVASDVGGEVGRKVIFCSVDGSAKVKRLG